MADNNTEQFDEGSIIGGITERTVGAATPADVAADNADRRAAETPITPATQTPEGTTTTPVTTTEVKPTTETPATPPVTSKKSDNVLSDLDKVLDGITVPQKKTDVKPQTPPTAPVIQQQPKPEDREGFVDLSEFGEQQQVWLKRMPADGRKYFADLIKADKTTKEELGVTKKKLADISVGKVTIPDNYYDNPEAYKLTPEYHEHTTNVSIAASIRNHWSEQLKLIEAGKDWQDTEDVIDPKTGAVRIQLKEPQPASPEAKAYINDNLIHSSLQLRDMEAKAGAMREVFKVKHQAYTEHVRSLESKHYPQFDDEKYEGRKTLAQVENELVKGGIAFKNDPKFGLLARALTMNYIYANYIKNNVNKQNTAQTLKVEAAKAGPTGNNFTTTGNSKPEAKKLDLKAMSALLDS